MSLAQPILNRAEIVLRLHAIFPEETPNRGYCVRELAASTVFTALYVGAIEGHDRFFGPKFVYSMSHEQAELTDEASRMAYAKAVMKGGFEATGRRGYRDNTREPIRDETLREGLVPVGAVVEKTDIATTSSKPR